MARKKEQIECPIRYLTDDEVHAMNLKKDKTSFLDNLKKASSNSGGGFSAKRIRSEQQNKKKTEFNTGKKSEGLADSVLLIPEKEEIIDDEHWQELMLRFDELSPIEDITDEEREYYRRKSDGDKFDDMFKNERSMLSDVLNNAQKRSKMVESKLSAMSGKGSYGVSKNYNDLVEAANSIDNLKLQTIKAIADLKKTSADLRMKDQKNNPVVVDEDNDTIADRFYKSIINGGSQKFIQSSTDPYMNSGLSSGGSFNITQPLVRQSTPMSNSNTYEEEPNSQAPFNGTISSQPDYYSSVSKDDADQFGYIRNENRNVEICVYHYDDDSYEFVALDEHGDVVDDYELPNAILADSLSVKPMSNYAYDKYQRKYRIIEMSSTVDIGDMEDIDYDSITNDDKYNYHY